MKVKINELKVGDSFSYINRKSIVFKITEIIKETVYFISNGKEYNANYDESLVFKVNP